MSDEFKKVCAQDGPYTVEVTKGERYFWCSCGLSKIQPMCDGAHKGTGMKCVPFYAEQTGTMYLCGCKDTKNPPFCDGSHSAI
ncbi:MAG: CDGSH iron-sulfur domain-containing protein [Alphaproteobacteria bacterium]